MTRRKMSRRTLLRGAGTVAVGLPLLDAMRAVPSRAATPEPPVRAFNIFFGLGLPTPLQAEAYSGPIAPLAPLVDKLVVVRGVNQRRCDRSGENAHFDGAAGAFVGVRSRGEAQSGGISIDQHLRRAAYPNGLPQGVIPTLAMGTYFRRSRLTRYGHTWNEDGSPADLPKEQPSALFDRIFGEDPSMTAGAQTAAEAKRQRYRRSILDSVVGQYQHYMGDAGNLGTASRARLSDHLDRIRQHELRVFGMGMETAGCEVPGAPGASPLPHGSAADPDGEGIDITLTDLVNEWRLMADLYLLGVQCDRVRFGAITFQAAGERIRLTGRYEHDGELIYNFDDRGDRGTGGSSGCSHEFWHGFNASRDNTQLRAHVHLMMREIGYLLTGLDDPEHADENGLSILQNSLVSISTESGDGRHSDVNRELSGVFHAFSGGNERLRTGEVVDLGDAEGLDVYNTIGRAYGIETKMGPADRPLEEVTAILR